MVDLRRVRLGQRDKVDSERLTRLAERQHGVLSAAQLRKAGLTRAAISRWSAAGRLHRIHRGVYAQGHRALSIDGRLHAALLYAGPKAALSHTTAAWLWKIIETEPTRIHLSVPGRLPSLPEVRVHHPRALNPVHHHGFPVTPPPRTLIDLSSMLTPRQLRRALAEADYRGLLDLPEAASVLRRGRPGSAVLRDALRSHLPSLAQTRSVLEERFLELCGAAALPQPEVNVPLGGFTVDALWREQGLAVELDGAAAHGSWARIKADRQRELTLRGLGYTVARYTWEQLTEHPAEVAADLRALLAAQELSPERPSRP